MPFGSIPSPNEVNRIIDDYEEDFDDDTRTLFDAGIQFGMALSGPSKERLEHIEDGRRLLKDAGLI